MRINPLKDARCYLSGPIENDSPTHNWRDLPKKVLTERFEIDLFDPFCDPVQQKTGELLEARKNLDFETMASIAKNFVSKDLTMVERSDLLVAYLPKGIPTAGTHHEIIFSSNSKKPTLLVCPEGKEFVPLWYFGFIPHTCMFGSWDQLFDYLQDVKDWKHTDNRRWFYRYGLI